MARSTLLSYVLLILCLGAASLPAQEPEMIAPPIPSVMPPEPPDPDTLPPPAPADWQPLGPKGGEESGGVTAAIEVPPPQTAAAITPPPLPMVETPVPGLPDPSQQELVKPDVEIWREQSELPQVPARQFNQLAQAYVTGTEPVWLRVQFDPLAAGKDVYVRPGRGITLTLPTPVLTVSASGECLFLAQLREGVNRSHIIFYCEGVRTGLPVVRAPLATVIAAELETGGGH